MHAGSESRLTLLPGAQYHYFLSNVGKTTPQEGDFETAQAMINPSREGTLEVERAAPIKSTVLAPATSVPVRYQCAGSSHSRADSSHERADSSDSAIARTVSSA